MFIEKEYYCIKEIIVKALHLSLLHFRVCVECSVQRQDQIFSFCCAL